VDGVTTPPLAAGAAVHERETAPAGRAAGPSGAVLMVIGACVSLQFGAALAAHLFPVAGPAGATLLRLLIAGALMLALTRPAMRGWSSGQWRAVLIFGSTLAAMNASFYAALSRIPLGSAVTIEFLGPLALAAVLSRRARDLVWVGMAAAGVLLLGLDGESSTANGVAGLDPVGVALALTAGVFWALYILGATKVGASVPGQGGLAAATAVAALLVLPFGAQGAVAALGRPEVLLLAVGVAVLSSVVPYSLEFVALRRVPPAVFGVLLSLEPAIATMAGWLLLGQTIGALGGLAVGIVVAASIGSTRTR
jgi:inner membrane transporter RhtA